ncbi:MAG TPA: ATP-binding domain-containing protein, partial [bacterium]|nr:ATP-binding domain-containing protein [bacterium]
ADDKKIIKNYINKNNIGELNTAYMIAQFDDLITYYSPADADECYLAYAITVHKSQGSEFDCVILPMCADYYINLNKNLIYTAITRAKKMCIIIGKLSVFYSGIKRNLTEQRNSYIAELLKK